MPCRREPEGRGLQKGLKNEAEFANSYLQQKSWEWGENIL